MGGALGLVQVNGLAAAYSAADAALKSADVTLLAMERVDGDALILLKFTGDVASVQAAVEIGAQVARGVSTHVVGHVMARTAFPLTSQKSEKIMPKIVCDEKVDTCSNDSPNSAVAIELESNELKGDITNEQRTRNGRNKRVDSSN